VVAAETRRTPSAALNPPAHGIDELPALTKGDNVTNALMATVKRDGTTIGQHAFFQRRNIVIGRNYSSDIVLDDPTISRMHAEISCEDGAYFVNDLGSVNGIYVNGEREQRLPLHHRDVVAIGDYEIELTFRDSVARDDWGSMMRNTDPTLRVALRRSATRS
jgi:predicted component of type VI protein secretion system